MIPTRADIGNWLINLPRSVERRAKMEDQLTRIGLPYTLFEAVDGRAMAAELEPRLDRAAFRRNMGREALPGEIGCYFSHLAVWQALVDSPFQYALVLEDDVVFHDDFLPALDAALGRTDAWDMLKLNRIRAKVPVLQGQAGPYRLNAYLGPATGFGAYLISRDFAAKVLPQMEPMRMPVDYEGTRWWAHDFRLLGLEPFPSHVDDGGMSTINGTNFANVVKPPKYKRLGNYAMRAGNYLRRLVAMLHRGMFFMKKSAESGK